MFVQFVLVPEKIKGKEMKKKNPWVCGTFPFVLYVLMTIIEVTGIHLSA